MSLTTEWGLMAMSKRIIAPQKGAQERFLASHAQICIYGGAAGGGKTCGMLIDALRWKDREGYGAVFFRKNHNQIFSQGGLWDEGMKLYSGIARAYPQLGRSRWVFRGSDGHEVSKISFAHIEREQDVHKWQGSQICGLYFDELTHFSEKTFFYMLSRNRSTCGVTPYVRASCNPDADSWVAKFISWWIDPDTGYKISRYYEGSRNADASNEVDLKACMAKLRTLHQSGIKVPHSFDIREKIKFYVSICESAGASMNREAIPFEDFDKVYKDEMELCDILDRTGREKTIAHIDSVPDNFLFLEGADVSDTERDLSLVKLIDWEYCGMCDPLVDVGMFIIYAYMNETEAERLIRIYFDREPTREELAVIYSYISLGGFLWALWAVYKEILGITFGDYTLKMYAYAKDYYKKAMKLWKNVSIKS